MDAATRLLQSGCPGGGKSETENGLWGRKHTGTKEGGTFISDGTEDKIKAQESDAVGKKRKKGPNKGRNLTKKATLTTEGGKKSKKNHPKKHATF